MRVRLELHGPGGTFDATSPATTLGAVLERLRGAATLVWVNAQQVLDAGVEPWMELPLWAPGDDFAWLCRVDVARAIAAGLTFRPLEETIVDTLAWDRSVPGDRPTLAHGREQEILAAA